MPPLQLIGPGTYTIGRHTYYGAGLSLHTWLKGETISIGSFCSIAPGVVIHCGGRHRYDFASTFPFEEVITKTRRDRIAITTKPTVVGNDVWIGESAMILGGANIGHGAIVGAGSVVLGKVPQYAVVAGNPAEVLFFRFDRDVKARLLKLEWWNWPDEYILQNVEWFYRPVREFLDHFEG